MSLSLNADYPTSAYCKVHCTFLRSICYWPVWETGYWTTDLIKDNTAYVKGSYKMASHYTIIDYFSKYSGKFNFHLNCRRLVGRTSIRCLNEVFKKRDQLLVWKWNPGFSVPEAQQHIQTFSKENEMCQEWKSPLLLRGSISSSSANSACDRGKLISRSL